MKTNELFKSVTSSCDRKVTEAVKQLQKKFYDDLNSVIEKAISGLSQEEILNFCYCSIEYKLEPDGVLYRDGNVSFRSNIHIDPRKTMKSEKRNFGYIGNVSKDFLLFLMKLNKCSRFIVGEDGDTDLCELQEITTESDYTDYEWTIHFIIVP